MDGRMIWESNPRRDILTPCRTSINVAHVPLATGMKGQFSMSEPITIHPSRLSAFGPADGAAFCLITNPENAEAIVVEHDGSYRDYLTVLLGAGDEFDDVLVQQVPQEAHVVVISPVHFF